MREAQRVSHRGFVRVRQTLSQWVRLSHSASGTEGASQSVRVPSALAVKRWVCEPKSHNTCVSVCVCVCACMRVCVCMGVGRGTEDRREIWGLVVGRG